jgi:hypothetical protein
MAALLRAPDAKFLGGVARNLLASSPPFPGRIGSKESIAAHARLLPFYAKRVPPAE